MDKTIDILKGMEKKQLKRLPVGIQTFSEVIDLDCLYIDKTEYIWNMIHLSKYIFLSRPRRFGKSLLLSTLQAYFEGRKDLFKGLFIETVEKNWTEYPVLRLSMASGKHMEKGSYFIKIVEWNLKGQGICFIFRTAERTFPIAECTFPTAEYTFRSGEYK